MWLFIHIKKRDSIVLFDQINFHLEHSSSVRLLRSEHAPLALGFFYRVFKEGNKHQVPFNELITFLDDYLY